MSSRREAASALSLHDSEIRFAVAPPGGRYYSVTWCRKQESTVQIC